LGTQSELDKDNLVIRLGLAWLTEQAGRKDDAVKQYRTIATDAWEKEKSLTMVGIGGQTLTGEVVSYLVPLLDAEKDKREIETLKATSPPWESCRTQSLPSQCRWPMGSPPPISKRPTRG
jgi:hypothetical protein